MERAVHTSCTSRSRPAAPPPTSSRRSRIVERVGFPVLVRPSYVLGGRAMQIVHDRNHLARAMAELAGFGSLGKEGGLSAERPVLIDRFLEDATEVDVDAIRDHTGEVLIGGVMEHVEEAGVHSGDSACAIPPQTLPPWVVEVIEAYTKSIAKALDVRGLINVQYAVLGHHGVRHRGQPACQPHGAVRRQGHRRAAGQGGQPGDARRDARRAARRGPAAAAVRPRARGRSRRPCCRSAGSPRSTPRSARRCAQHRRGDGHRHHVRQGVLQGRAGGRHRCCPPRAPCSCRSPTATSRPGWWSPSGCASSASASPPPRAPPTTSAASASAVDLVVGKICDGDGINAVNLIDERRDRVRHQHAAGPRRAHRRRADPQGGQHPPRQLGHHRRGRAGRRAGHGRAWSATTSACARCRSSTRDDRRVDARRWRPIRAARSSVSRFDVGSVAAQPGDDRVGHGRARGRAGAVLRPRRARCASSSSRWPRSSGRATRRRACTRPASG